MSRYAARISELEDELEEVYETLSERDKQISQLEKQKRTLEHHIHRHYESKSISSTVDTDTATATSQEDNDTFTSKPQRQLARDEITRLRAILKETQEEGKELKKDNHQLLHQVKSHQTLLDSQKRKIAEATKAVQKSEQEWKHHLKFQYELELEHQRLRETIQLLEENEQKLIQEVKTLSNECQQAEDSNQRIAEKYQAIRLQLDDKKTSFLEVEKEKREFELKCNVLNRDMKLLQEQRIKDTETHNLQVQTLESKLEEEQKKTSQLQKNMEAMHFKDSRKIIHDLKTKLLHETNQNVYLRQETQQMEKDLEVACQALKNVKIQHKKDLSNAIEKEKEAHIQTEVALNSSLEREKDMKLKCSDLESQLMNMELKLNQVTERNHMYEKTHGLEDIAMYQKKLEMDIQRRDHDLKDLNVRIGCEMDRSRLLENACQLLKEKSGLDDDFLNDEQVRREMNFMERNLNMQNKELCRQIDVLEADRLRLLRQLRENASHPVGSNAPKFVGLSDSQFLKVTEFAANLKKGLVQLPLDDRSKELNSQIADLKAEREVNILTMKRMKMEISVIYREKNTQIDPESATNTSIKTRIDSEDESTTQCIEQSRGGEQNQQSTLNTDEGHSDTNIGNEETLRHHENKKEITEKLSNNCQTEKFKEIIQNKSNHDMFHDRYQGKLGNNNHPQLSECLKQLLVNALEIKQNESEQKHLEEKFETMQHQLVITYKRHLEIIDNMERKITQQQNTIKSLTISPDDPTFDDEKDCEKNSEQVSRKIRDLQGMIKVETEARIKNEIKSIEFEAYFKHRISYLEQWKDKCTEQMENMQYLIDDSIPLHQYEDAMHEIDYLREEYLNRVKQDCDRKLRMEEMREEKTELNELRRKCDELNIQLLELKSKIESAEGYQSKIQNMDNSTHLETRLKCEEMRVKKCEKRNNQLIDEISKMREANEVLFQEKENLLNKGREICASQQKIEAKFKNGLDASEARSLQHQNKVVTTQLNDAHREIEKHKEIANIATSQVCSLNAINENLVNEINGMQNNFSNVETESDDQTVLSQLRRQIMIEKQRNEKNSMSYDELKALFGKQNIKIHDLEKEIDKYRANKANLRKKWQIEKNGFRRACFLLSKEGANTQLTWQMSVHGVDKDFQGFEPNQKIQPKMNSLRETKLLEDRLNHLIKTSEQKTKKLAECESRMKNLKDQFDRVFEEKASLESQLVDLRNPQNKDNDTDGTLGRLFSLAEEVKQRKMDQFQSNREIGVLNEEISHLKTTIAQNESNMRKIDNIRIEQERKSYLLEREVCQANRLSLNFDELPLEDFSSKSFQNEIHEEHKIKTVCKASQTLLSNDTDAMEKIHDTINMRQSQHTQTENWSIDQVDFNKHLREQLVNLGEKVEIFDHHDGHLDDHIKIIKAAFAAIQDLKKVALEKDTLVDRYRRELNLINKNKYDDYKSEQNTSLPSNKTDESESSTLNKIKNNAVDLTSPFEFSRLQERIKEAEMSVKEKSSKIAHLKKLLDLINIEKEDFKIKNEDNLKEMERMRMDLCTLAVQLQDKGINRPGSKHTQSLYVNSTEVASLKVSEKKLKDDVNKLKRLVKEKNMGLSSLKQTEIELVDIKAKFTNAMKEITDLKRTLTVARMERDRVQKSLQACKERESCALDKNTKLEDEVNRMRTVVHEVVKAKDDARNRALKLTNQLKQFRETINEEKTNNQKLLDLEYQLQNEKKKVASIMKKNIQLRASLAARVLNPTQNNEKNKGVTLHKSRTNHSRYANGKHNRSEDSPAFASEPTNNQHIEDNFNYMFPEKTFTSSVKRTHQTETTTPAHILCELEQTRIACFNVEEENTRLKRLNKLELPAQIAQLRLELNEANAARNQAINDLSHFKKLLSEQGVEKSLLFDQELKVARDFSQEKLKDFEADILAKNTKINQLKYELNEAQENKQRCVRRNKELEHILGEMMKSMKEGNVKTVETHKEEQNDSKCEDSFEKRVQLKMSRSTNKYTQANTDSIKIKELEEKVEERNSLIQKLMIRIDKIEDERDTLSTNLSQKIKSSSNSKGENDDSVRDKVKKADKSFEKLEKEVTNLKEKLSLTTNEKELLAKKLRRLVASSMVMEKQLRAEAHKFQKEKEDLTRELKAFDLDFFEEIEDLKYKYSEAVRRLKQYERDEHYR